MIPPAPPDDSTLAVSSLGGVIGRFPCTEADFNTTPLGSRSSSCKQAELLLFFFELPITAMAPSSPPPPGSPPPSWSLSPGELFLFSDISSGVDLKTLVEKRSLIFHLQLLPLLFDITIYHTFTKSFSPTSTPS